MPERIEVPPTLSGDTQTKIQQIWRYLYSMSEILNRNMQSIGGNELTDRERASMMTILQKTSVNGQAETESLKDMVVRTADYVQNVLSRIADGTLTEEVSSGRFGRFVNETAVSVPVNPAGTLQEGMLSAVLQKIKNDDIRIRNYIYTGELRTNEYGTAIGKDVVTFAQDGTETYHPENAMMEILDGEIRAVNQTTMTGNLTGNVTGNLTGNVTGNLTGIVLPAETAETDLDDITSQGQYWIEMDDMSSGPADLTTGTVLLEVMTTTEIIYQRISTEDAIYSRQQAVGSWSSWEKYEGI